MREQGRLQVLENRQSDSVEAFYKVAMVVKGSLGKIAILDVLTVISCSVNIATIDPFRRGERILCSEVTRPITSKLG